MVKVILARNIGFCSGVRRAIAITGKTLKHSGKKRVYSLGAVIHNPEVIAKLDRKGLVTVHSLGEVVDGSTLILPSHGSPHGVIEQGRDKKLTLVDVTCPYVSSVQKICRTLHENGEAVVIIGDRQHPEIKALRDFAPSAVVIDKASDVTVNQFAYRKVGIISQTTQSREKFFRLVGAIMEKNPSGCEFHIYNTICLDTSKRQEEVKKLAGEVDVLLVIGSRISANTKRLLHLGRKANPSTFLVEQERQVDQKALKGARTVGIISGASAPSWLVNAVVKKIKELKK
jgi:4-hydroxy-3-methylbut-2-enyl diphosphate reductase